MKIIFKTLLLTKFYFLISLLRRGLSPDKVRNGGESEPQDEDVGPVSRASTLIRYDTCPLDQVHRTCTLTRYDTRI